MDSPAGYDAVIVWKVDRLARRVLDFLHADEALQGRGAGIVAVEDPIDMTTPQGRAFAIMLAVFGEMEAEAIKHEAKPGAPRFGHGDDDRSGIPERNSFRFPARALQDDRVFLAPARREVAARPRSKA
jgi:hypothetical protein